MAIGPIDYTMQGVQAPGTAFLQGAQTGANIAQVQMQREAMAAKMEEARRAAIEAQQQRAAQEAARADFFANPRPTMRDALMFAQTLDKDQLAAFKPYIERLSSDEKQSRLRFGLGVLSALESDPTVAANLLTERAAAEENEGNTADASFYRDLVGSIQRGDPASAFKVATTLVAPLPGAKEAMEAREKARGAEAGRTISAAADKIKAGLVDDQGKPLPGTFFATPGKKPELVEGTKPKAGFKVLTTDEAKTRGLPTQGFTWQINENTGEISSLVKPPQAAVQVNLPGQPVVEREEQKAKGTFNVKQYEGLVTTANVAARVLPALVTQEKLLAKGFETGFGTQAKKVGASVLSALGVPEAENFAANAETFFAAMNNAVLQKQLDQKGPQTEADAQRISATGAQLGNTVRGNQFIIALAKAQLKRDVEKRRFWDNYWRNRKTYEGAEEAWESGPGAASIFDAPELKPFLNVAPPQPKAAAPTPPTAPATPAGAGEFRIRSVRPSGG